VEFLGEATNGFTITSANSATEGDGPVTATLTMSIAQASPVTVALSSSDATAATVPASVSLAAGETSTTFQITPVDDAVADGTQTTVITATAAGVGPGTKSFAVLDDETATLSLSLPASVAEGGASGSATVTRSVVSSSPVTVTLASSDPTAATVPETVVIPANQASATFAVAPVNDTKIDGTQSTTISASVAGWTGASGSVDVLDNESLALTVTAPTSVTEGGTGSGSVSISGTLTTALTVNLSSNQAKLTVPATVTIAAGATSASFTATAPNDTLAAANVTATITASAAGFTNGSGNTTVIDNDVSNFGFATITSPKTLASPFSITITARNVSGSTVTGFTGTVNLSGVGASGAISMTPTVTTAFSAGVWTGSITINTATTNIVLTANDGAGRTGTSNSFTVGVGSLHHFAFSNVTSPKTAGTAFSTTITAQDIANNTVTSFASTATLSVPSSRTVGTATTSTTTLPLYTFYHDERTQCIYLQGEIGGATTIRGLTLNVTTVPGQTMNNWTIRMKHTALSSYATNAWESTGWTTVYQSNETISTTGLKTFTFTTPFAYDGVNNLMVDFSFNNSSFTSAGGVTYTTANANRVIYAYTDSGWGDPLTWSGTGSPTPTTTTILPNLLLQTGAANTLTPTTTGTFTAGVWTGNVTVNQAASQAALMAANGTTALGYSNDFSVTSTVTANAQSVNVPTNTATAITLTGQDSANPGATLTYAVVTNPVNGVLSGTGANRTYTPNTGFTGSDSFTFTAANGVVTSLPATVSMTVAAAQEISIEQPLSTILTDGVSTIDYGTIPTGSGTVRTFTVKNLGALPLTVSSITKDGTNSTDVTIGAISSSTISGGSSATFDVIFTPAASGARTAAIHVMSNDSDEGSFDIGLTATGSAAFPDIAIEQPAGTLRPDEAAIIDFGLSMLATPVVSTFTIRNIGGTDLSLSGTTIDGAGGTNFSAGTLSALSIPVGGTATLDVTFLPTSSGAKLAALHVLSNDPDEGSYDIELHGIGGIASGPLTLARDINATGNGGTLTNFVTSGANVFYLQGLSLYRTNGTAAGTTLISNSANSTAASAVAVIGTNVFFVGTDTTASTELWSYNGTTAARLADINPGTSSSSPALLTVVGTTLYFTATTAANGQELWKSDGTAIGTVLVKDIVTGTTGSSPANLTNVGGTLFFTANDGTNGTELWKSDGTAAGTVMVSNINTAAGASSTPANLTAIGSTVYFSASNGTTTGLNGTELWKSDGTTTSLVLDINTGTASSSPAGLYNAGGTLYFRATTTAAGVELYKSDGTGAGTVLVKDIFTGTGSSTPSNFALAGSALFFTATDSAANGVELWKTDGTNAGTVMVKNINPAASGSSNPATLTAVGSTLYFTATDGATGSELWKSDGSGAGTVLVEEIVLGTGGPGITAMFNYSGTLLLGATDAVTGQELWRSDGTVPGTYRVLDALVGNVSASPANLTALGGQVIFSASDGLTGTELWKSDGSSAGTVQVRDIASGVNSSLPANFAVVNSTLYLTASDVTNGTELWKSDGTTAGTTMVANINPTAGTSSFPTLLRNVAGTLFFAATDTTANGQELWKSDGTTLGTVLVKNINPTANAGSSISGSVAAGSLLYFSANDGANGAELWKSDGTNAGTVLVKNINPTAATGSSPTNITQVGSLIFFSANDGVNGTELWVTDGTDAGTLLVKDINPAAGSSSPSSLVAYNGVLYFSATDGVNGTELWRSDGTNAGTYMLLDINPGVNSSSVANMRVHNGVLYFTSSDSFGNEVWRSDGTVAGTYLLRDLSQGSTSSLPGNLTSVGGYLYFSASHPTYGLDLWRSDGTSAGTQMVFDFNPGASGFGPAVLTQSGNRLFFTVTQTGVGNELFSLDLGADPEIAVYEGADTTGVERQDNTGTYSFGTHSMPPTRSFTLKNNGTGLLYVNDITVSGTNSASFFVLGKPNSSLAVQPGGTATFTVTASLEGPPVQSAVVSILCNDADETAFDIPVTVTVDDTIPPVISAPATWLIGQPGTLAMSLPDLRSIVAYSDNRPGDGTITQDPIPGDIVLGIGETATVTFTATDSAGNASNTITTLVQMGLGQPNTGNVAWARSGGVAAAEINVNRVAAMPDGGVVVAGAFSTSPLVLGTAGVDQVSLTSAGGADVFVARFDKNGGLLWAQRGGGANAEAVSAVSTLPDGSVVITGSYSNAAATFGSVTLTNAGSNDTFLVRYLPNGTVAWAKGYGGAGGDSSSQMIALSDGNISIVGTYGSTTTTTLAPGVTLVNQGGAATDYFLIKFQASDGTALWARTFGSSAVSENSALSLAPLPSGGVAFAGSMLSAALSISGSATTLTNTGAAGTADSMVTAFDSAGGLLWAKNAGGGTGAEAPTVLQTFSNGDVAVAGTFTSATATFGTQSFTTLGSTDVFLLRLSGATGTQIWAKRAGGSGADSAAAMLVLPDDSVMLTGLYPNGSMQLGIGESRQTTLTAPTANNKLYVARFSGGDGTLRWAKTTGGSAIDTVNGLAILGEQDIGLAGSFTTPSITFGPGESGAVSFTNLGTGSDVFAAKFSREDGSLIWAKRGGGVNSDFVQAVTALPNGSLFVAGTFQPPAATFGAGESGETVLANIEATGTNTDFFFARFHGGGVEPPAAPLVDLLPASGLSASTLTFNARIDSRGQETTVVIEYGPTTAYGTSVPVTAVPAGFGTTDRSLGLSGLAPLSTLNFRVVATNAAGTTTSANQAITTYADAEIVVEDSLGGSLTDGASTVSFGTVAVGGSQNRVFTIRNSGAAGSLTGLAISKDGVAAADYSIGAPGATSLLPGESTTFTVTYAPSAGGIRTAAIHIASNDGDENPFSITLSGDNFLDTALATAVDIPITQNGYTVPTGRSLRVNLSFAPPVGTPITIINNTAATPISGNFTDLPEGGILTATFGGQTHLFHASYTGGDGNDLVLLRAYDWTWMHGGNTATPLSSYGTQGVSSPSNSLPGRSAAMTWTDATGNLWVFGGFNGFYLTDLWRFSRTTLQWTWMKGTLSTNQNGAYGSQGVASSGNAPGSRQGGVTWIDSSGRMWLFGGFGYPASGTTAGILNDLWRYDPATNNWTWIGGSAAINANGTYGTQGTAAPSNTPGARQLATTWIDAAGNLWLFGGTGLPATGTAQGTLNDLWRFDPVSAQWTWVKGGNVISVNGTYGSLGTPALANTPGTRQGAAGWSDDQGRFWLFGGNGYGSGILGSSLGDLWRYDPVTNMWTWINGTASSTANQNGVYGRQGIAAAANAPGYRSNAASWRDIRGRLWLFGGTGRAATGSTAAELNDLWSYDPASNQWTWVKGAQNHQNNGAYGTLGQPSASNLPGARQQPASFATNAAVRDLWLLGGLGFASTGTTAGRLNDLWHLDLPDLPHVTTDLANFFAKSATLNATASASENHATTLRFRYSTTANLSGAIVTPSQSVTGYRQAFSELISGLQANTQYYFRAEAASAIGTALGQTFAYTTSPAPEIQVELPAGTPFVNAATAAIGTSAIGQSSSRTFTLRNTGSATLNVSSAIIGTHATEFAITGLASALAAGGSASFTITFTPATGASGTRTASLELYSNDVDVTDSPFVINLDATVTTAAYGSWAAANGLTGANNGPNQDPDGDSLTNLQEFAFGLNPNVGGNPQLIFAGGVLVQRGIPIPRVEAQAFGVNYQAAYVRNMDAVAAGYTYTVQFSGDSISNWVNSTTTPTVQATDGNVQAVTVPYPFLITLPGGARVKPRFFRILVTPP
jgi:ELWxxDGT repeat protein